MADNSIIDLPLNEEGTGYDREAVDAYLAQVDAHVTATNEEYEKKIAGFESRTDMAKTTDILANASNIAQQYVDEAQQRADLAVREAEAKATAITQEAEKEAARRLAAADRTSQHRLIDADRRAGNAIEEALTEVQNLVRSAQTKLQEATRRSESLTNEAERKYADAVSAAGEITSDADEYDAKVRAAADEYLTNTRREANEEATAIRVTADRILNEAQAEAIRLRRDAEVEYDEKMASITADLANGRTALEHFQRYYDDSLQRLHDFYGGKMAEVATLAQFQFPDGYDETDREDVVPDADTEDNEENASIDFAQFDVPAEYDDSEAISPLSAGPERETISIDDFQESDATIADETNPANRFDYLDYEDDVIELNGK